MFVQFNNFFYGNFLWSDNENFYGLYMHAEEVLILEKQFYTENFPPFWPDETPICTTL